MKKMLSLICLLSIYSCFCQDGRFDPHTGTHLGRELLEKLTSPSPWLKSREEVLDLLPKEGICAEIGVGEGDFSHSIKAISKPTKVYLIDCWEQQDRSAYPDDFNVATDLQIKRYESVKQAFKDDANIEVLRMYSKDAAALFPDEHFDWVYIDSNHTYAAVKEDLEMWLPKVKNGGYICGHDYILPREVHGLQFGVVPAVNEFIKKHSLELVYLTTEKFATYVIRVKK